MAISDINTVCITGRLTRDSETKSTASGICVCRFSIAVNRRQKSGDGWTDEADYFDVVLWGKAGESLGRYLTKGRQVSVEGELRQSRWEQEGRKYSKVEIYAGKVLLAGNAESSEGGVKKQPSEGHASAESDDFVGQVRADFDGSDVPF